MSSSPVPPDSPGQRCTLNLSRAETSSRGVVWYGIGLELTTVRSRGPRHNCKAITARREVIVLIIFFRVDVDPLPIAVFIRNFITGNENANKLEKEARNLKNDSVVNVTLLDTIAVEIQIERSVNSCHQHCNINGDRAFITKTLARLRTGHYKEMKIDRDDRRAYKTSQVQS
ncbi:hypothetical protein TNCV_4973131 [Trichonephila clavipes]|nr:hypothetical protein TNCV_4973131 [Trichonephila clavipes]